MLGDGSSRPPGERWHERATPVFGGVGIFGGLLAGSAPRWRSGATEATWELGGILAGCTILFVAGLIDDVCTLSPVAKLVAQFGAAAARARPASRSR